MVYATALTLLLLRADTTAHSGECTRGAQHTRSLSYVAALYILYETGNIYVHRTAGHTLRIRAVHAPRSLKYRLFG